MKQNRKKYAQLLMQLYEHNKLVVGKACIYFNYPNKIIVETITFPVPISDIKGLALRLYKKGSRLIKDKTND
jgi:hypothetical protein